jgi:hypothetical protein
MLSNQRNGVDNIACLVKGAMLSNQRNGVDNIACLVKGAMLSNQINGVDHIGTLPDKLCTQKKFTVKYFSTSYVVRPKTN